MVQEGRVMVCRQSVNGGFGRMRMGVWIARGLLICGLALPTACSTVPRSEGRFVDEHGQATRRIHVVSHGWHTGIVVPTDVAISYLPDLEKRFGSVAFLEFGWGDKGFYQAETISAGLAVQAMFWPTDAVMHVVAVPERADRYFPQSEVVSLCVSDAALASMMQFVARSFVRNAHGLAPSQNGLYGDSQFYAAVGDYFMFNTCNTWTATGLYEAGVEISPHLLTASAVMRAVATAAEGTAEVEDSAGRATVIASCR